MSGLATHVQCNFTFNTHLFANIAAADEAASGQKLLARLLNTMDQKHYPLSSILAFVFSNNAQGKCEFIFEYFSFSLKVIWQTIASNTAWAKTSEAQRMGSRSQGSVLLWGP